MARALASVTKGGMTVREAALHYGVPRSTLGDRVSGKVLTGAVSGPQMYLDEEEEKELVQSSLVVHVKFSTRMSRECLQVKCVTKRGERNAVALFSGNKSQITIVAYVSSSGSCMPPMVILDRKTLPQRFG